jgi:uncharacterized membrane protein
MPLIEHSVTINRPIGEVFRFIADFRNDPQWQPDVKAVHLSETPPRVGVMVTQTRNTFLFSWRLDLNADIVTYNLNKSIELKGVLGQFPVNMTYTIESSRGTTQVKQSYDVRMGFLFGLFAPMLSGVMRRRTRATLEKLKTLLESRAEQAPSADPRQEA